MKIRNTLSLLCFLLVFNSFAQQQRPNVILILTDDIGYGDIGSHGNVHIKTPNLDALHAKSIRFTNFHVGTTCSPTRAMLMTGKNNNKVGVWHTVNGREILNKDEKILPQFLEEEGYRTGIFGKWHLGDNYPFRPQDRGFQEVLIHGGGGVGQTPDFWGNDYFGDTYFRNGKAEKFSEYCDDVWFKEAMSFMEKQKSRPFFCFISTNVAHHPYHVPEEYSKQYENNPDIPNPQFAGMITKVDENIGKLMAFLADNDLDNNTIILFLSDNGTAEGANLDQNGFVKRGFNARMRGKKGSVYEGGHRVPLFLFDPRLQNKTPEIHSLTSGMDILPTILELCQIKPDDVFDGISLVPLSKGQTLPKRSIIADTQRGEYLTKNQAYSVMSEGWRLVNGNELYEIQEDPEQRKNIAAQFPDKVEFMKQEYEKWWQEVSVQKSDYQRVIVGSRKQKMVCLTSHDLHVEKGLPAWNQELVKSEKGENGFWAIEVSKKSVYKVELRRFPQESALAIPPQYLTAKLEINGQIQTASIPKESLKIEFKLAIPKGNHTLKTWLLTGNGESVEAAYVYVQRRR
jgi:arylsulfatase A-like enzyme